jgi:hypothetical protein
MRQFGVATAISIRCATNSLTRLGISIWLFGVVEPGAGRSHSQDIGAIPRDCSKARSTLLQSILHDKINQAVWHHYLLYDLLSIKKAGHTWISANHKNEIGA